MPKANRTPAPSRSAAGSPPPLPDDVLRQSVGECFNIHQSTVAMGSIFMGFVFAALLQLLARDADLTRLQQCAVWILVCALLLLLGGLLCFHITANQVYRYWNIFFPNSKARTIAAILFPLGIIFMLLAVAVMLFSKDMYPLGFIVTCSAISLVCLLFKIGAFHRRDAPYVRDIDQPRVDPPQGSSSPGGAKA